MDSASIYRTVFGEGARPDAWQHKFTAREWPEILIAPTGSGKTAAVTLGWAAHRMRAPETTRRRLVWCLPMRTLVDQTVRSVNEWFEKLKQAGVDEEWVQGEWAESADTVEGAHAHRRVDREDRPLPPADALGEADRPRTRSVTLSSRRLGLVARIDLVESDGESVVPVDYKRGKRPHVAAGAYDPERVQLCVQGLLLEENGYRCTEGVLYFAESRERVRVVFDEELREATRGAIGGLRLVAAGGRIPPPLRDSPKCPRCSLVGICLPGEVNHFHRTGATPRPIAVRRDEALPLYVQANNVHLAKKGETITLTEEDGPTTTARLIDVSQVVLMGNARMTTPCLHALMRREIPVTRHSYGGWFLGHTVGLGHKNVELREAQYRASFTPAVSLADGWRPRWPRCSRTPAPRWPRPR